MKFKDAMELVREWYPKHYINIEVSMQYFDHTDHEEVSYRIYVNTVPSVNATHYSLDAALEMVRPNTMTIDDQFDMVESVLEGIGQ